MTLKTPPSTTPLKPQGTSNAPDPNTGFYGQVAQSLITRLRGAALNIRHGITQQIRDEAKAQERVIYLIARDLDIRLPGQPPPPNAAPHIVGCVGRSDLMSPPTITWTCAPGCPAKGSSAG